MRELEVFKKQLLDLPGLQNTLENLPQVSCPVSHHFADGQYVRETFMPSGTLAIGKVHKNKIVNILLKGKIVVFMGEGIPVKTLEAPAVFTSEAGIQKVAYFLEDTTWLNCHPTEETDIAKIENEVIETKEITWHG